MFGLVEESENIELVTLDQINGSYTFLNELFREFKPLSVDAFKPDRALELADQAMYFGVINQKAPPPVTFNAGSGSTSASQESSPPPARPPSVEWTPPARSPTTQRPSPPLFEDTNIMKKGRQKEATTLERTSSASSSQSPTSRVLPPDQPNIIHWVPPPSWDKKADSDFNSSSDYGDPLEGEGMISDAPGTAAGLKRAAGPTTPIENSPPRPKMPRMSPESATALNTRATEVLRQRNQKKYTFDEYGFPLASAVKPLQETNPDVRASTSQPRTDNNSNYSSWTAPPSTNMYQGVGDWEDWIPKSVVQPLNTPSQRRISRDWDRGDYQPAPRSQPGSSTQGNYYSSYSNVPNSDNLEVSPDLNKHNRVGFVYLTIPYVEGEANMGVMISKDYRRKGLARQAVDLVLKCAFEEFKLHRVQTLVVDSPSKDSAITFLIQMGFTHEGTRRRSVFAPTGAWADVTYFSMLDTDWTMRRCIRPAPCSLWDEMFARHQREREELLRWDNRRLKRTTSLETIRGPLASGPVVHEIMYDSSVVPETDMGDTESFASFPDTVSGPARSLVGDGSETDEDNLSSLSASSQGSPSMRSVSSVSRRWEVLSSASEPLASDSEVSDFEVIDDI